MIENFAIFPLRKIIDGRCSCSDPECETIGKHPACFWSKFAPGQREAGEPGAGLGIRTGREFGIFVVETDQKNGVNGEKNLLDLGPVPDTYLVQTPSGSLHHYFTWPDGVDYLKTSGNELAPGVDVRASGGFVVAEGSPHKKGGVYEALHGTTFADIAEAPQWLVEAIQATEKRGGDDAREAYVPSDMSTADGQYRLALAEEFARGARPAIEGSNGSSWTLVMGAKMTREYGLPLEVAFDVLAEHWNPRCEPPWNDKDLYRKVEEGATKVGVVPDLCGVDLLGLEQVFRDAVLAKTVVAAPPADVAAVDEAEMPLITGDHVELATRLRARYLGVLKYCEGDAYIYDAARGVWVVDVDKGRCSAYLQAFSGATIRPLDVDAKSTTCKLRSSDIDGALKLALGKVADPEFFEKAPIGLVCRNGFVRLGQGGIELVDHAPEHRSRVSYDLDFDAAAPSPLWDAFLASLFRGDADAAEKCLFVEEFLGGALFGLSPHFQKCLVAVGTGANGKSALVEIMETVFPEGSTTALSPQEFSCSRAEYYLALLRGKRLNILSELSSRTIADSSFMKKIVPGDTLHAREPHGRAFSFRPIAGHFFAANQLPDVDDTTKGFWRKMVVVTFNRSFEGTECVPGIAKIIAAAERGGILARLAAGAARLLRQDGYTELSSGQAAKRAWAVDSDQVARFLEERVAVLEQCKGQSEGVQATALYAAYVAWAEANGEKPVTNRDFGHRAKSRGVGARKGTNFNYYPVRLVAGNAGISGSMN